MVMIVCYVSALLLPSFLPKTFFLTQWLNKLGVLGITILCVVVLMILQDNGKPVLQYGLVSKKCFNWGIFFMVGAAVYGANAVSNQATGITTFLLEVLQPLLGGKPVFVFIFLLLAFAIITTNFANNAGMAVVLLPVVMAFADQYPTVNTVVICMSITMMVFVALMTPAASPYCGMMHARTDAISLKEITKLGAPMCILAVVIYTFIGFPIANLLF
jgi:sodium-dependent dicarboxylate transporter 2/3/5